jgi:hypothetical protein
MTVASAPGTERIVYFIGIPPLSSEESRGRHVLGDAQPACSSSPIDTGFWQKFRRFRAKLDGKKGEQKNEEKYKKLVVFA